MLSKKCYANGVISKTLSFITILCVIENRHIYEIKLIEHKCRKQIMATLHVNLNYIKIIRTRKWFTEIVLDTGLLPYYWYAKNCIQL